MLSLIKSILQRIVAPPGSPQRSRLSIMAQHLCNIQWGFKIRGSSFIPPPKVVFLASLVAELLG